VNKAMSGILPVGGRTLASRFRREDRWVFPAIAGLGRRLAQEQG
jgi:hypothetical protein